MDAARAAAMSDPDRNRWFSRRWVEPVTTGPRAPWTGDPSSRGQTTPEQLGRSLRDAWRQERRGRAKAPAT